MAILKDILRDGFAVQGQTYSAGELALLYREHNFDRWHHYVLVTYTVVGNELFPNEARGKARSDAEAVAWFQKHYDLEDADYTIYREETTYTPLAGTIVEAPDGQ